MAGTWKKIESWADSGGFGMGDWFHLRDAVLITPEEKPFAKKPGRPGRHPAVLLSKVEGPAAPLWPRSASGGRGIIHDAHPRTGDHARCPLDIYGWVCNHVRCTVLSRHLDATWTCSEPLESPLWDALREPGEGS